jgi:uncharacterized beta-barrel protein YwiB (DUF1934 family)
MTIEGGAAFIDYKLDGDDCSLFVSSDRIEQTRKGNVNIKISFMRGEKTACIIGGEDLRGGYTVYTKSLLSSVGKFGCTAALSYLSGEDEEQISLKISALQVK